jgi:hypothetical protein
MAVSFEDRRETPFPPELSSTNSSAVTPNSTISSSNIANKTESTPVRISLPPKTASATSARSNSPSKQTKFDIDSPEMRNYISRGRRSNGVPFTKIERGLRGVEERKLVSILSESTK